MKNFFLLLIFFCLLINPFSNAKDSRTSNLTIQEKIELIIPSDRHILEMFFRNLFLNGDFSLTLFGDKPLGSIDVIINEEFFNKQVISFYLGWKTWQKYQESFTSSKFVFIHYDQINSTSFFGFNLINKKRCYQVINQHLALFQSCFTFHNIDELINQFCSEGIYSNPLLQRKKNFYACLGLLFGYGEKSSILFERRMQLIRLAGQNPSDLTRLNKSDVASICNLSKLYFIEDNSSPPIEKVIEELNELANIKNYVSGSKSINHSLYPIKIHGFMSFGEDPEIDIIQSKNDEVLEKLMEIFYSNNFLEIVLSKLCE